MLRALSACVVFFALLATASAQTDIPAGSRLEAIVNNKVVRIAYRADATPFSFVNERKEPIGYSIDLCKLVVKSLEQQFVLQGLNIEWIPVTVQTRFSAIADGKADMECGSSTMSLARMRDVDFSSVIFVESTALLVTRAANVGAFADMKGKKIAVVGGTTNEQAVMRAIGQHNIDATLVAVQDRDEGIAALEAGKVDGYASDKLLLVGAQLKHPDALVMLAEDLSIEPYAIVLPRGDWALRWAVNTGLAQVLRSGQVVPVYQKWFGQFGLEPGVLLRAAFMLGALPD